MIKYKENENEEQIHRVMTSLKVKNSNEKIKENSLTFWNKLSVNLTSAMGTWYYLFGNIILIIGYIILQKFVPFDIQLLYLNFFLSLQAAIGMPILQMSSNLSEKRNEIRAEADYETNKKNEMYLTHMHTKVDDIYNQIDVQAKEISELKELINNISEKLDNQKGA